MLSDALTSRQTCCRKELALLTSVAIDPDRLSDKHLFLAGVLLRSMTKQ